MDNKNITHSIVIQGGLGNQLFQIFALINYCIKHNYKWVFPKNMQVWDKRETYWETCFKNLNMYTVDNSIIDSFESYNSVFHYKEIPILSKNTTLNGYFQSEKYFKDNYAKIYKLIGFDRLREGIKRLIPEENTISLHFRMGDFGNLAHHPLINDAYYNSSIRHILENTESKDFTIYYSCEQTDEHIASKRIQGMKTNFPTIKFKQISNQLDDYEQMLFMSCCNHNIIANSTFSWWSAYFNDNSGKIVCYPSTWFGYAKRELNLNDLHPNEWVKVDTN